MARLYTWPSVVGTAALVALPVIAAAQTTGTTPHTPTSEPQTETRTGTTQNDSPRQHLEKAKQALDQVQRNAVTGKESSKLNDLKRHVSALDKSYRETPGSATGTAQRSETGREQAGSSSDWNTHLSAADRALTDLLADEGRSADATRTESGTTGATGTTGTTGTTERSDTLDPQVRTQLEEVRRHLTAFAATASGATASGTMGATSSPPSTPTTASPDATTPPTTPMTTPDPTQPDPTSQPTQPTQPSEPPATGTTSGAPTSSQAGQSNVDQAREHLSQARQALADLTALPQAQQLAGEARNQVSQLISQFNTLITTEEDWQTHYQEVNQTLTQMLSADAGATSGTGTDGAVGTSGATDDAQLDPAVRNQLVQFRTHLQAFYAAASGTKGAAGASGATSSSMSGSMSGSTTEPTSSSSGSMTSGTGAQTPPAASQPGSMSSAGDAERHIAEIERIVNEALGTSSATGMGAATGTTSGTSATGTTTGTTPGTTPGTTTDSTTGTTTGTAGTTAAGATVTVERAKLEEIRRHLQQLRQSIR